MRIDEFSRHELRESQATTQEFTSQIQELQKRMNYLNDSPEFQDVESICSGKLSHVPSQPAIVPSLGGMLSRDPSLRPDTWNSVHRVTFFDSPRAVIDTSSTPYQGMLHSWNQSATGDNPVRESTGKFVSRSEERNRETIPTPRFGRRPWTMDFSFFPAEGAYPQNYVADQSRLRISELQFGKFPTPSTFSFWKERFETQASACSSSPSEALWWIKEVVMVDLWTIWNHRAKFRVILISRILRFWVRRLRLLWTRSSRIHISKRRSVWRTESSERGSVPSRKTDRLHGLWLLSSYWRSWYSPWLCWSIHITLRNDDDV